MKLPLPGVILTAALLFVSAVNGADLKNRSTSASGQFVVYCDDRELRGRVIMFVEETKDRILRLLKERDDWDMPLLITLDRAEPGKSEPGVRLGLVQTPAGGKVEMNVRIGDDPASIFLQKHVVRAVFLEMSYRDRPLVSGKPIIEPPWWVAEGLIQSMRRRDGELNSDVFKSIADRSKLPALDKFISQPPVMLGGISGEVDRASAMCLVEALLSLPNGPENLGRLIRDWPAISADPMGALVHHFPSLAESDKSLAKWWSLQLARFAVSERWQGLALEESDKELSNVLSLNIVMDKTGRSERFALAAFEKFIALPGAKQSLRAAQVRLVAFSTRANPLFRPVVTDYEQAVALLIAGKTKEAGEKITGAESYRKKLIGRMALITDYLNWFEATQVTGRNGVFDNYLRAAKGAEPKPAAPVDPRITDYLDTMEREFEPVRTVVPDPSKNAVMR